MKNIKYNLRKNGSKPVKSEIKAENPEKVLEQFYAEAEERLNERLYEIDRRTIKDGQECGEYASEIVEHMKRMEEEPENRDLYTEAGYLEKQKDLNEKMRGILLDWLVEVHLKFKLLPETLYLTVNLIDRVLEREHISRQRLQLVGVTCMLIASKYEEIYAPEVRDFVYITDKAYAKADILRMETRILSLLKFRVAVPSAFRFLSRFHKILAGDSLSFNLSGYLSELALLEYRMLKYPPSLIAASAVYLAHKILKRSPSFHPAITAETQYLETDIKPVAKDLLSLVKNISSSSLKALTKKFSQSKLQEVAKLSFSIEI